MANEDLRPYCYVLVEIRGKDNLFVDVFSMAQLAIDYLRAMYLDDLQKIDQDADDEERYGILFLVKKEHKYFNIKKKYLSF